MLGIQHSSREKGMWRAWFRSGESLEVCWGWRGGSGLACRVLIHSNDCDNGSRMINLGLIWAQVYIPIGIVPGPYQVGEEPSWGFDLSREFGIVLTWGKWRKHWDWPFHRIVLSWDYETEDGGWQSTSTSFRDMTPGEEWERRPNARKILSPYRYTLRSGVVQEVTATVIRERCIRGRHILTRLLGWPKRTEYAIDVEFSDEVGERSGSWKGGTVGCGYTMLPGETPLECLGRMEREREFR